LDTNICIFAIRNSNDNVLKKFREHLEDELYISSITLAELMYGVEKSRKPEQNRNALLQFLTLIDIKEFSEKAAIEYGKIRAFLENQGTPIGPLDTLIAAHAVSENMILVTHNTKEFLRIPDLTVENWTFE
ncbi:MAG: type II toxin-antitoxin system VapC family toxin, partial [Spirochaetes bacterium]|nr:type II toxin-antitoxin system VapC family toxin [Candidatus Ornithospirochaeta stercoravium]